MILYLTLTKMFIHSNVRYVEDKIKITQSNCNTEMFHRTSEKITVTYFLTMKNVNFLYKCISVYINNKHTTIYYTIHMHDHF